MLRILVVDDDRSMRLYMQALLVADGYAVTTAANGRQALSVMDKEHIDLVVLDLMMPEMDGYELTGALRAFNEALPILTVSWDRRLYDQAD